MGRSHIDENGFKVIEAMPISVVGVFPYLGRQIDYDGEMGLEPNKIYYVFRSPEELFDKEAMASFNGKPFIDNHEMLGKGFKPVDKRPADGTIYNVRRSKDMPDYLIADTNIFTEKMIKKIADGKRELSLGYRCQYVPEAGTWNGIPYQFKQTNLRGNHLALVEHGRCGSSVCVCDGALVTMDSLPKEIRDMENEEKKGAKALASKLDTCLKGGDEEGCQDCLDFLDLSPEQRKAALSAVKKAKGDDKAKTPAEDSKAKDDDVIPPPPEKGADKEDDGDDDAKGEAPAAKPAPAPAAAPAPAEAAAPAEETVAAAEEVTEETPAADCKAKDCGTKDCKPKAKKKTEDAGEPCCKEGKGGKPCCEDKGAKDCGATATAPSIPVPVAKVKDDCPGCGKDDDECECKEEVKEKVEITQDEMDAIAARVRADYHRAQKLATAIRPVVGAFDSAEMSEVQVARHAVKNIPALAFAADSADDVVLGVVRGYIANRAASPAQPKTFKVATAADEAPKSKKTADARSIENSLRAFYN